VEGEEYHWKRRREEPPSAASGFGREDGKVRSGVRLIARPAPVTGYEWKNASGVFQVEWNRGSFRLYFRKGK